MQNYSQTLDLDMLNQRYWHRRMQQCKAEFKTRLPQPVTTASASPSFSDKLQSPTSPDLSYTGSPTPASVTPSVSKSVDSRYMEQTPPEHSSSKSDPRLAYSQKGMEKGRPIPASSKPSRPIKYQVR